MITESFHEYKGYIIRLRAVTNSGFSYSIIKKIQNDKSPNGFKNIYLRKITYNYIKPGVLIQKAYDYINEFEHLLIEKFNKHL